MDLKKTVTKFFEDVPKSVIGIDIGSGNIKIAQVDLSGKRADGDQCCQRRIAGGHGQ
jgi:Tfp pilus assembly PilM family ATPase